MKHTIVLIKAGHMDEYISQKNWLWLQFKELVKARPATTAARVYVAVGKEIRGKMGWGKTNVVDSFLGLNEKELEDIMKFSWKTSFRWYNPKNDRILRRCTN